MPVAARKTAVVTLGFVLIWVALGFAAFIKSIYCFSKKGTMSQNILGLILAIIFGPFFFLYKPVGYC